MSRNTIQPKGPLKGTTYDSGRAVRTPVAVVATVMVNVDAQMLGRIQVYWNDSSGLGANDPKNWQIARQLLPFGGYCDDRGSTEDYGSTNSNPYSWGSWSSPPDVGSRVLCIFEQGKNDEGYYLGVVPRVGRMRTIPTIPKTSDPVKAVATNQKQAESFGGAEGLPVGLPNPNFPVLLGQLLTGASPIHVYQAYTYHTQGTLRDNVRGPLTSSAERESPSRVGWGVITPGRPVYKKDASDSEAKAFFDNPDVEAAGDYEIIGRKGGHSIVMDDGTSGGIDNLIRIRTAGGHQILMRDDKGTETLSILAKEGHYIELGAGGTIDIWAPNSINLSTGGDLNLHAERDINIHARNNLRMMSASGDTSMESGANFNQTVKKDATHWSGKNWTTRSEGGWATAAAGEASIETPQKVVIVGSDRINLNTGGPSITPQQPPPLELKQHYGTKLSPAGWLSVVGKLLSICTRLPVHLPWPGAGTKLPGIVPTGEEP